jgi:hypothetical protein
MGVGFKKLEAKEENATAHRRLCRRLLSCSLCRPNRGENAKRRPAHGTRKPKKKAKSNRA